MLWLTAPATLTPRRENFPDRFSSAITARLNAAPARE